MKEGILPRTVRREGFKDGARDYAALPVMMQSKCSSPISLSSPVSCGQNQTRATLAPTDLCSLGVLNDSIGRVFLQFLGEAGIFFFIGF